MKQFSAAVGSLDSSVQEFFHQIVIHLQYLILQCCAPLVHGWNHVDLGEKLFSSSRLYQFSDLSYELENLGQVALGNWSVMIGFTSPRPCFFISFWIPFNSW